MLRSSVVLAKEVGGDDAYSLIPYIHTEEQAISPQDLFIWWRWKVLIMVFPGKAMKKTKIGGGGGVSISV